MRSFFLKWILESYLQKESNRLQVVSFSSRPISSIMFYKTILDVLTCIMHLPGHREFKVCIFILFRQVDTGSNKKLGAFTALDLENEKMLSL